MKNTKTSLVSLELEGISGTAKSKKTSLDLSGIPGGVITENNSKKLYLESGNKNTAFDRSGVSRETFDSSARNNYAKAKSDKAKSNFTWGIENTSDDAVKMSAVRKKIVELNKNKEFYKNSLKFETKALPSDTTEADYKKKIKEIDTQIETLEKQYESLSKDSLLPYSAGAYTLKVNNDENQKRQAVSEEQFNNDANLTIKHGTYQNYIDGIELGVNGYKGAPSTENFDFVNDTMSKLDDALKTEGAKIKIHTDKLNSITKQIEEKNKLVERLSGMAKNGDEIASKVLNEVLSELDGLISSYDSAYAEYEKAFPAYKKALDDYNGFYGTYAKEADKYNREYEEYKKSVRSVEETQRDIEQASAELEKVKSRIKDINDMLSSKTSAPSNPGQLIRELESLKKVEDEFEFKLSLLKKENHDAVYFGYESLRNNEDFEENSEYKSTANGKEAKPGLTGSYLYGGGETGFGDIEYEYINKIDDAITVVNAENINSGNPLVYPVLSQAEKLQMTENEVKIYNYLYATNGKKAADEYITFLTSELNRREREQKEEEARKYAQEHPVLSSIGTVLASPLKLVSFAGQVVDYLDDQDIDENAGYNVYSYVPTAIRSEVSKKIENGWGGKVGSFTYNLGMSMADFLYSSAITGGNQALTLAILGSSSAADTTLSAIDRGLSDGQALSLGIISGVAEVVTEKISIDALFKGDWTKSATRYILKNALAEGSEEGISDIINITADILISKDKSEWAVAIEEYKKQGLSESQAFLKALGDQALTVGLDVLGGGISGSTLATGNVAVQSARTYLKYGATPSNLSKLGAEQRKRGDAAIYNAIEEGLKLPENSEAYKLAKKIKADLDAGKTVSDFNLGKLIYKDLKGVIAEDTKNTPQVNVLPTAAETESASAQVTVNPESDISKNELKLQTFDEYSKQQRMNNAETELERSAIEFDVSDTRLDAAKRLSKLTGRELVFYSEEADENGYISDGYFDRNTGIIHMNVKSENPFAQIFGHELTHSIENSEGYSDFKKFVFDRLEAEGKNIEQLRNEKRYRYSKKNITFKTQDEVDADIIAEYVQKNLLTDESRIREVVNFKPKIAERFKYVIDKICAALGSVDAEKNAFMFKAKKMYADALNGTQTSFDSDTSKKRIDFSNESEDSYENKNVSAENTLTKENIGEDLTSGEIDDAEYDDLSDLMESDEAEYKDFQYAISMLNDGRKFVKADRKVISGNDPKIWINQIYDYINNKIRKGKDVILLTDDGDLLSITEDTAGKARFRNFSVKENGDKVYLTDDEFRVKLNAEAHIDELSRISKRGKKDVPDKNGKHKVLAKDGWNYRTAYFQDFDGKYYKLKISTAKNSSVVTIYNVGEIKERNLHNQAGKSALNGSSSNNRGAKTVKTSTGSISNSYGFVNTKNKQSSVSKKSDVQNEGIFDNIPRATLPTAETLSKKGVESNAGLVYNDNDNSNDNNKLVLPRAAQDKQYSISDIFKRKDIDNGKEGQNILHDGRGGWQSLPRSREQGSRLFERAEKNQTEIGKRRAYAQRLRISERTIQKVIEDYTYEEIIKSAYNSELKSIEKFFSDKGLKILFMVGNIKNADATIDNPGIIIGGKTVIVSVTHAYSPWKIAKHEYIHSVYETDQFYKIPQMVHSQFLPNQIEKLFLSPRYSPYFELYSGDESAVFEEIVCDIFAGVSSKNIAYPFKNLVEAFWNEDFDYINNFGENDYVSYEEAFPEKVKTNKPQNRAYAVSRISSTKTDAPEYLSNLPDKKSQRILEGIERSFINRVSEILSVPKNASREFLKPIVQEISREFLETGNVSHESIKRLYDIAYDRGRVISREFYDENKHVKEYLRNQRIAISDAVKGDFTDWNDFRKSTMGTLNLVSGSGLQPDIVYMEVSDMAPHLFPSDIINPAEQVRKMFEVAKSIRAVENTLDEEFGEQFREYAINDFSNAVLKAVSELNNVKRYIEDVNGPDDSLDVPTTEEQLLKMWDDYKKVSRECDKVVARNLLTSSDEMQVGRLLRGEIDISHLNPATDNVEGIKAVYEAKNEREKILKALKKYRDTFKARLRSDVDEFLETAINWKDKSRGLLYAREIMERNIEDIVNDKELANKINAHYFTPVHKAEAQKIRFLKEYRDKIRALELSREIAKGNIASEAHAVQLIGEAQDNIAYLERAKGRVKARDGKTIDEWRDVIKKFWAENPNLDQNKIQEAIKQFRAIYDDLFKQMNVVRVKFGYEPVNYRQGYFPHFQPGGSDGIMASFGRILGIDTNVDVLPTSINGLTHMFKPGITYFGNIQERLGFNTAYDAVQGFDKYLQGISDVIFHTENIQKLRALASQIRYRTTDDGIRAQVDEVRADTTKTEEEKTALINNIYEKGKFTLSNFVNELDEYTNILANKKSKRDRNAEADIGRGLYSFMKKFEGNVAANMIAGNLSSALTNFIPLQQAFVALPATELVNAMYETLKAYKVDDKIAGMSDFLTARRGSDVLVKAWQQNYGTGRNTFNKFWDGLSMIADKGSIPMELIDTFVSETIVRAKYNINRKSGMSETSAMEDADEFTARLMAARTKGSMPTIFGAKNPLYKMFTMFQLEVNNQFSFLFKDIPRGLKDKAIGVLILAFLKFFIGARIFNDAFEKLFGRRPALDPFEILNDFVGDVSGYKAPNFFDIVGDVIKGEKPDFTTEKKRLDDSVLELGLNVAEELPFVSSIVGGGRLPVQSALPDENIVRAFFNSNWDGKKRFSVLQNQIANSLGYTLLPGGYNQIQKTVKGINAFAKGGSYSVDNEGNDILQYPIYKDTAYETGVNAVKSALLGKSSLPTANDWVDGGFKSFGAEQTKTYKELTEGGEKDRESFELIKKVSSARNDKGDITAAAKTEVLYFSDASGFAKKTVFYNLIASDNEKALIDGLEKSGSNPDKYIDVILEMKGKEKKSEKYDFLAGVNLNDDELVEFASFLMGDELVTEEGNPTQYAKFVDVVDTGLDANDAFQMVYDGVNLDKYLELAGNNLDVATSKATSEALSALEPEGNKKFVSNIKKWNAVLDTTSDVQKQLKAFKVVMPDGDYSKVQICYSYGLNPEVYVKLKEALPSFDENDNGSYSNAEIENAIDAICSPSGKITLPGGNKKFNLTNNQKAVLWQVATGSKSSKNNPYSSAYGQKVLDAKETGNNDGKLVLPK